MSVFVKQALICFRIIELSFAFTAFTLSLLDINASLNSIKINNIFFTKADLLIIAVIIQPQRDGESLFS